MDSKELDFKIRNYNSELDIQGEAGGDYGHRLADALSRRGYFRLNSPVKKRQNFVKSSFPSCVDSSEREMLKKILDWRERVLQNQ
jgi:hypothetical protein